MGSWEQVHATSEIIKLLLKTRQQIQNGVPGAKLHITKLSLAYSSGFPRNCQLGIA